MTTTHYHHHKPNKGRIVHDHAGGTKRHQHYGKDYVGYSKTKPPAPKKRPAKKVTRRTHHQYGLDFNSAITGVVGLAAVSEVVGIVK